MKTITRIALVAGLTFALADPAQAQMTEPSGGISFGAQLTSGDGLLGSVKVVGGVGVAELGATLMAPPANPLSFFTADAYLAFVGSTASFLPINLQPVMGFGMATNFRDVPAPRGTGTTLDLGMWMYMPVGLRYNIGVRNLNVGVEALYHLPAVYMLKGVTDPARWHFEANTRLGVLDAAAFYELGAVYNGPGVRVGLTF